MRRLPITTLIASSMVLPRALEACPAHHHLVARSVVRWWTPDPLVIPMLLGTSLLYGLGLATLWTEAGRGHGIRRWQAVAYAAGMATLVLALVSPLDRLSDIFFSAHMAQHELLILVAAPLIVLGRPLVPYLFALPRNVREDLAKALQRPRMRRAWRAATHPLVVLLGHGLALWLWHIPALFEAALASEPVHAVQHAMFFGTAALFWWSLVHGRYGRAGYGVAVLYVFATAMHSGLLGALLTVAGRQWYPTHAARSEAWGLEGLRDQQLAGLIMWIPAGVLLALMALALLAAWLGEAERRAVRASHSRAGRPSPSTQDMTVETPLPLPVPAVDARH